MRRLAWLMMGASDTETSILSEASPPGHPGTVGFGS